MPQKDKDELFEFCQKVDLHIMSPQANINSTITVAIEHGFRSIVIPSCKLNDIKRSVEDIKIVAVIDYPFGMSSLDTRVYSIMSAKDNGADEVEIVSPYHLGYKNLRDFNKDINKCMEASEKVGITLRYVFDPNITDLKDVIQLKILKIFSNNELKDISTSLGSIDKIDHSENILKMRAIKHKTGCRTKTFVSTNDASVFALYPKAGADLFGLDWRSACNLVHAYEDMVTERND